MLGGVTRIQLFPCFSADLHDVHQQGHSFRRSGGGLMNLLGAGMLQKLGTTHFRSCPAALRETVHDMPGCVSVMSVSEQHELLEEDMQLRLLGNATAPSTVWALTSAFRAQLLKTYPQL